MPASIGQLYVNIVTRPYTKRTQGLFTSGQSAAKMTMPEMSMVSPVRKREPPVAACHLATFVLPSCFRPSWLQQPILLKSSGCVVQCLTRREITQNISRFLAVVFFKHKLMYFYQMTFSNKWFCLHKAIDISYANHRYGSMTAKSKNHIFLCLQ